MVAPSFIEEVVHSVLPDAKVQPTDLTGTGDHWHVRIVDAAFEGQRPLARQRVVLGAFKELIRTDVVHALDLQCMTPTEAG